MSGRKQIQGVGKVVFAILAPVAGEVALLSQKVIKLIQEIFSVPLESTGSNEIGRLLLGIS